MEISNTESLTLEKQAELLKCAENLKPLIQKIPKPDRIESFDCCTEKYESPKISVIVPVYNVEKYLFRSMNSILKQTCREIEIICVDDCSTDSSFQILNFFALLDARVQVIRHTKNSYAGVARNTGMAKAKGEYLYFFDPDDWCECDLLKNAVQNGDLFHSDIVLLKEVHINAETSPKLFFWKTPKNCPEPFSWESYPGNIFRLIPPSPWNKLFRNEFIKCEKIQFQNLRFTNDVYFSMMAMALAKRISFINGPCLYHYRTDNQNSLQHTKSSGPNCSLNAFRAILQSLKKMGKTELVKQLQIYISTLTLEYELLDKPPKGNAFKEFYFDLRSNFIKEAGLDTFHQFETEGQKILFQSIQDNTNEYNFLIEMIQYYRSLYQMKSDEFLRLQNSLSYRLGRIITWPVRIIWYFIQHCSRNDKAE